MRLQSPKSIIAIMYVHLEPCGGCQDTGSGTLKRKPYLGPVSEGTNENQEEKADVEI